MSCKQFDLFFRMLFFSLMIFIFRPISGSTQPADDPLLLQTAVIRGIDIQGNTITREAIILRELTFSVHDTVALSFLQNQLDQSRINLLNTSLFNFVTLTSEIVKEGEVIIHIRVTERWYVWPTPIFQYTDRNFNSWWKSQDFTRVNYGFRVKWSNFRGRMEDMDFLLQLGKNQQVEVVYSRPYIDRRKHFGVGVAAGFRRMREAGFLTRYDRLEYMFDRRFLSQQYYGAILFYYRRGIHTIHSASVRIEKVHFADTLLLANPDYFFMGKTGGAFLNFFYKLKIDHRDARYYPLSGWYTDLEISKSGFGMQFEGPVDIFWIKSASRYYKPLSPRWYFGAGASVKWSSTSDQPYYFMQGLGYERDFVRGYEYYVVDGEDYSLFRANLKFAILPQRVSNIACIPSEKFSRIHYASYLNLYADVGYVWNSKHSGLYGNELPESLLYGAGLGMDVVTYYDKVLRVEFSVNKSGESGIFIHFIAGI